MKQIHQGQTTLETPLKFIQSFFGFIQGFRQQKFSFGIVNISNHILKTLSGLSEMDHSILRPFVLTLNINRSYSLLNNLCILYYIHMVM